MVIDVVDDVGVAVFELEDEPPVGLDTNRPKPFSISFEGVKTKTGSIHIFDLDCAIQQRQHLREPARVYDPDTCCATSPEKPFESFVSKGFDHVLSVTHWVTVFKESFGCEWRPLATNWDEWISDELAVRPQTKDDLK